MKKLAFTLSEILISLVIIGVIAAITIFALTSNSKAQEAQATLKKALSEVNQALTMHYALHGLTPADYNSNQHLVDSLFKKRLNVIDGPETFTNGCENGAVFITEDGIIFCITDQFSPGNISNSGTVCDSRSKYPCGTPPNLYIDINGLKSPNRHTEHSKKPYDIFLATIYSQKIVPYGKATQEILFGHELTSSSDNNQEGNDQPTQPEGGGSSGVNPPIEPENPDIKPAPENPDLGGGDDKEPPEYDPNRWPTWEDFLKWLAEFFFGHHN